MATKAGRYDEVLFSTHGTAGTIKAMNADTVQVEVFESDGTTNATLYDDRDKTAYSGTGSIVTPDVAGNIEFFADPGIYVLEISDDGTVLRTDTVNVSVDGVEAGALASVTSDETVTGAWDFTGGISENGTALSGTYARVFGVDADTYGDGVTDATAHINSRIDAADAAGGGVVYFPQGTYLTDGINLSGKDCTLIGQGSQAVTIKANAGITGYVVSVPTDWAGESPNAQARVPFGGFLIEGTGSADATLATGGLSIVNVGALYASDIGIKSTGGPCIYLEDVILSDFSGITCNRPVGADTNDVPYAHMVGYCNGNEYDRWGFRSVTSDPDGTAVVKVEPSASFTPHDSKFSAPWLEFQHTPDNGSIFEIHGNAIVIEDIQPFDEASAVASPTGNCYVRFVGGGANVVRGRIPGRGTGASDIAYGVICEASRSRIIGTRGFRDHNVRLDLGVGYTFIELGGSYSGTGTVDAVEDNSGETTNVIVNSTERTFEFGGWKFDAPNRRVTDGSDGGTLGLGSGGTKLSTTSVAPKYLRINADQMFLLSLAGTNTVTFRPDGSNTFAEISPPSTIRKGFVISAGAQNSAVDILEVTRDGAVVFEIQGTGKALFGQSVEHQGVVQLAQYTTVGRPTASSAGVGGSIYDTDLSKPIWSDGTDWRDAAGTVV